MDDTLEADLRAIAKSDAVPSILKIVCEATGLRFAAVARVTESRWTACAVRDGVGLGIAPGGDLDLNTTLCKEVCAGAEPIVIENAREDPLYRDHHTPRLYGLESYISYPIRRSTGKLFGTLCALDNVPAVLRHPQTDALFTLLARLIGLQIDAADRFRESERLRVLEKEQSTLREQFIAVLGHDLRNPLFAMTAGTEVLLRSALPDPALGTVKRMQASGLRMTALIDNLTDFARGRMGGGIAIVKRPEQGLEVALRHVAAELMAVQPERRVDLRIRIGEPVRCDVARMGQLLSNLLGNALIHGDAHGPVEVVAAIDGDSFVVAVSNRGPDIPPERQSRLFEPYYRDVDGRAHQGLGLGLYIASEIARAHGGEIGVESKDLLTTFTFRMPLAPT